MEKMLSIVCIYNNRETFMNKFMTSLKKQSYKNFELVAIDSTKYKFSKAAEALNYAGNKANGKYIVFLHQDIIFEEENFLEKLVGYCEKYNFGIAGVAGIKDGKSYSKIYHGYDRRRISKNVNKIDKVIEVDSLDECLLIIPKNIFEENNFRDIGKTWHLYGVDFCLQMQDIDKKVLLFPLSLWHYSSGNSFNLNYFYAIKNLCNVTLNRKNISTFWGKWPTNKIKLKLKIIYRKYRYIILRK